MNSFEKDGKTYTLTSLSHIQVYKDQLKLKKKSEAGMVIQKCEAVVIMQIYI